MKTNFTYKRFDFHQGNTAHISTKTNRGASAIKKLNRKVSQVDIEALRVMC